MQCRLLAYLAIFLFSANVHAAVQAAATSNSEAEEKKGFPITFGLSYDVKTDLAEEMRPRLLHHTASVSAGYELKDWVNFDASVGYYFTTVGSAYSRYKEDSGISYVDLGIGKRLSKDLGKFLGAKHSLSAGLNGSIPFTEDARLEGYRGTVGIGPSLSSKFFDGILSITNSVNYSFIFNRYDYSPVFLTATARNSYGYSVSGSVKIIGELRFGLGFGIRRTRYTDRFHDFSYYNSQSLSYSYKKASISVSHMNGGYTDDGKVDLWYVDKYRRLVSLGLGYSF